MRSILTPPDAPGYDPRRDERVGALESGRHVRLTPAAREGESSRTSQEFGPSEAAELADETVARQPLVIDALNKLNYFIPIDDQDFVGASPWELMAALETRVCRFIKACEASGFHPHFVVDNGWVSDEARDKWRQRKEEEVRDERRRMPYLADKLLCEAIRAEGATLYYAEDMDGDDVVAKLADELPGRPFVLSADRDMFRYNLPDANNRIFSEFSFTEDGKRIVLIESPTKCPRDGVTARALDDIGYDPESWIKYASKLGAVASLHHSDYIRGSCSSLVRRYGNLQGHALELRRAAYWELGAKDPVHEVYPEWDAVAGEVRWVESDVVPNDALLHLLEQPATALLYLLDQDPCDSSEAVDIEVAGDVAMRRFAAIVMVSELAVATQWHIGTGMLRTAMSLAEVARLKHRSASWPPLSRRGVFSCCTRSCEGVFVVLAQERTWLENMGYTTPTRCARCRIARKNAAAMNYANNKGQVCNFFLRTGRCRFGATCRFRHD